VQVRLLYDYNKIFFCKNSFITKLFDTTGAMLLNMRGRNRGSRPKHFPRRRRRRRRRRTHGLQRIVRRQIISPLLSLAQ
jgi:hypothetical protein